MVLMLWCPLLTKTWWIAVVAIVFTAVIGPILGAGVDARFGDLAAVRP